MSKLKDFLFEAANAVVDVVAGAATESVAVKVNERSQEVKEYKENKNNTSNED